MTVRLSAVGDHLHAVRPVPPVGRPGSVTNAAPEKLMLAVKGALPLSVPENAAVPPAANGLVATVQGPAAPAVMTVAPALVPTEIAHVPVLVAGVPIPGRP